jgi:hypothetical protein
MRRTLTAEDASTSHATILGAGAVSDFPEREDDSNKSTDGKKKQEIDREFLCIKH